MRIGLGVLSALLVLLVQTSLSSSGLWVVHAIESGRSGDADGVDLADVNGDGLPDLVVPREAAGEVRLYVSRGIAAWRAQSVCTGCTNVEDARFADLDGDTLDEIVSTHEGATRKVLIHWAKPGGGWQSTVLPAPSLQWMTVAAGQIDGLDGPDLVLGATGSDAGVYLATSYNPRDPESWEFTQLTEAQWTMSIFLYDLDRDRDLDVIFTDRETGVAWLENRGASGWSEYALGIGTAVRFAALGDVDGDGRVDVIVADSNPTTGSAVTWFRQPDKSQIRQLWRKYTVTPIGVSGVDAKSVALGDVNGDGRRDLIVGTGPNTHRIYWMRFAASPLEPKWAAAAIFDQDKVKLDTIRLLDVNHDGALDVVTTGGTPMGVFWLENPR